MTDSRLLPVGVLSGFLGAGKTTLLNHILQQDHGRRVCVIVNDMSAINIDSQQILRQDEDMVELQNGCICCTLRGDLVRALVRISAEGNCDYVLVESTGVGEPMPIAQAFESGVCEDTGAQLCSVARLDVMITVVDTAAFPRFFAGHAGLVKDIPDWGRPESDTRGISRLLIDQVSCANTIVLNKMDIASPDDVRIARDVIACLNPTATVIEADHGNLPCGAVIDANTWDVGQYVNTAAWRDEQDRIHVPETDEYGISSFSWVRSGVDSRPFPAAALAAFAAEGGLPLRGVLRAKGWVFIESAPDQRIRVNVTGAREKVEMVADSRWRVTEEAELLGLGDRIKKSGRRMLAAVQLEIEKLKQRGALSDTYGDRRQELVFIGRVEDGFDPGAIRRSLDALIEQ